MRGAPLALFICAAGALPGCASTSARASAPSAPSEAASLAQIEDAQRAWCDALLEIGRLGATGGDAAGFASTVLSTAYAYDEGRVLFKPTLTFGTQTFRMSKEGALAYFVGGDPRFPHDTGFALEPWVACRPVVQGVVVDGDIALAMGNVILTDRGGTDVTVDKTFGYRRAPGGALRIVLHHSSLPYTPAPSGAP